MKYLRQLWWSSAENLRDISEYCLYANCCCINPGCTFQLLSLLLLKRMLWWLIRGWLTEGSSWLSYDASFFMDPIQHHVNGCGPGSAGQGDVKLFPFMSCKWHQRDDCIAWNIIVRGRKRKAEEKQRESVKLCLQQPVVVVFYYMCVCVSLLVCFYCWQSMHSQRND